MGLKSTHKIHLYYVHIAKEILSKFKVIFSLKYGIMVWNFMFVTSCWLTKILKF